MTETKNLKKLIEESNKYIVDDEEYYLHLVEESELDLEAFNIPSQSLQMLSDSGMSPGLHSLYTPKFEQSPSP